MKTFWINEKASRADILYARRICNKAMKVAGPLVGGAGEINAVLYRLSQALMAVPKTIRVDRRPSLKALIGKADEIFSRYIRMKAANEYQNCQCVTCRKWASWPEMDNGHFIGRQYEVLRYNDKNCAPQCRPCNRFNEGHKAEYERYILERYGENTLLWLKANKKHKRFARYELEALIRHYEGEVKGMERK